MRDHVILLQVVIWVVFAIAWVLMAPPKSDEAERGRGEGRRGIPVAILAASGVACVVLYLLRMTEIAPLFPMQRELGVAISLLGLAGAIYSRLVLGRRWAVQPTACSEDELVERFPYSIVRHPIYGAQLVMCVGTALTASNIVVGLIFIGGCELVLRRRAAREEAVLNQATQGAYAEKFGSKGRFFPKVGRMK